jgi:formylmethanofuran dehydrogenase subunit E
MRTLEEDLAAAVEYHGHLCSGMALWWEGTCLIEVL